MQTHNETNNNASASILNYNYDTLIIHQSRLTSESVVAEQADGPVMEKE